MTIRPAQPGKPMPGRKRIQNFKNPATHPFRLEDYSSYPIQETVERLANVYAQALYRYGKDRKLDEDQARRNAVSEWLSQLPELTDKRSTCAYIACVAWGQKLHLLAPTEAKTMVYLAQTQLSLLRRNDL